MIYLVTHQSELFETSNYKIISVEESLQMLSKAELLQYDSETTGLDPHICQIRLIQFGSDKYDFQIVVDVESIPIFYYKEVLESKILIGHNIKFDLKFLYSVNIIPKRVYDTMIMEQLLHLGHKYDFGYFSLKETLWRRLSVSMSKEVRETITTARLNDSIIIYSAKDILYIEKLASSIKKDLKEKGLLTACQFECDAIPVMAYLEWCGIKLDENKWKAKMDNDLKRLNVATKALNDFVESNPLYESYTETPKYYDLFEEVDFSPKCIINWKSSKQVVPFVKMLGFNTLTYDRKARKFKDSVESKVLSTQKGINDVFLKLYLEFKGADKVVDSFGQVFIDSINPITGRLHTDYHQLGTASGRMSCGGSDNSDIALYRKLPKGSCKNLNHQQLPSDHETRSSFVSESGNLLCSCDYSALESRLGADIYDEKAMLKEYIEGSGDIHSLAAKSCFPEELEGIEIKDIKKLRPDLRKKAKAPEFSVQFGGGAKSISESLSITLEEAQMIENNFYKTFCGIKTFKEKGGKFVRQNGYIIMCHTTGHKMFWQGFERWKEEEARYREDKNFWNEYRELKEKNPEHPLVLEVKKHFATVSKQERLALNAPTQGSGAIIIKEAAVRLYNWILENNYFNKVKIVNITHDEINVEFPEELKDFFPEFLANLMKESAAKFYTKLEYPAEPAVGDHWIH